MLQGKKAFEDNRTDGLGSGELLATGFHKVEADRAQSWGGPSGEVGQKSDWRGRRTESGREGRRREGKERAREGSGQSLRKGFVKEEKEMGSLMRMWHLVSALFSRVLHF